MPVFVAPNPREFLERAGSLLEDKALNGLILGVARGILADRSRLGESGFFIVDRDGQPVAAGMITPPFNLLLSSATDHGAARELADSIHDDRASIPGVTGDRMAAAEFTDRWIDLTGATASLEMEQGILSVDAVIDVQSVAGGFRRATIDDLDLVVRWMLAFAAEALPRGLEDADRFEAITRRRLVETSSAGFWLWEIDGVAVAMSGQSGSTGAGIRINGVYTPPDKRGNGYATALVARQSSWLLDHGYRYCFLYTDLANPTSNALYRRIGYHQVAESAMYRFETTE